jgi:hypothetical protein
MEPKWHHHRHQHWVSRFRYGHSGQCTGWVLGVGGGHFLSAHVAACHSLNRVGPPSKSGVLFGGGGTWNQNSAVTISRSSGCGMCAAGQCTAQAGSGGGWVRGALREACIWLPATHHWVPLGVYFSGGGTWNQCGTLVVTITTTGSSGSDTSATGQLHCAGMRAGGGSGALGGVHMAACCSPSHWDPFPIQA